MLILFILLCGILIGSRVKSERLKKISQRMQIVFLACLIFIMGIGLSQTSLNINELFVILLKSLVLAVIPMTLSLVGVILFEGIFIKKKSKSAEKEDETWHS